MGSLRLVLDLVMSRILHNRILRVVWWTFWGLIDEITEGSELD